MDLKMIKIVVAHKAYFKYLIKASHKYVLDYLMELNHEF